MNTHADKTLENKSQTVANRLPKLQSKSESTFQFVDNRPEAIAQRKLQEAITNSPRVQQLKAYQEMANNSPQVSQLRAIQDRANNSPQFSKTAQLQAMTDNHSAQQQQPIQKKKNNTGLPDNLKTGMENLSGMSLDDVNVHRNSDKPAQLQAHAYAQGTDIHLGPGQEKHLPHEAWHVVQQKQGRVKPTMQMMGKVNVNDDAGLEKEADVMGKEAFQRGNIHSVTLVQQKNTENTAQLVSSHFSTQIVQRVDEGLPKVTKERISEDKDEEPKSRPRSGAVDEEPKSRPRSGAEVEDTLDQEEIEYLQKYRKVLNILKFNFAGSSEEEWATHAPEKVEKHWFKPDEGKADTSDQKENKLKARGEVAEHQSGGKKFSKKKDELEKSKTVFEYAGPLNIEGMFDLGANNTEVNIKDAQGEFLKFMESFVVAQQYAHDMPNVQINIKGFSRGAATATEFADWIKQTQYGKQVDVNLVVFDPVHGSNLVTGGDLFGAMAKRKAEQDVSSVYGGEEQLGISGTTYVFPVKSNYEALLKGFTVQKVSGYQRVIIGYGPHASHSFGVKGFTWGGKAIKGMKLSTLPQGLFVAEATSKEALAKGVNPMLKQITSLEDWQRFSPKLIGEAKSIQNRDDAVRAAGEEFFNAETVRANAIIKALEAIGIC
jgi:hypothetical protein